MLISGNSFNRQQNSLPKKRNHHRFIFICTCKPSPRCFLNTGGSLYDTRKDCKSLFFYCAGDHAVDQVFCKEQIQDHDGHGDKDGAGGEAGEFCFAKTHQTHCNSPGVLCFQQELGQDVVTPRPCKGCQGRVDDDRHGQGHVDLPEHLEIGCTVYSSCLVNGIGNGVKEALLHHVAQRRTGGVNQDQTPVVIDEIELRHQQIHSGHTHKGREHSQHQCGFHQRLAAFELEPGHAVSRQDRQKCTQNATHCGDKQRISKPLGIIVHGDIRKELFEAVQAILRREETLKGVDGAGCGERCQNQPQARKEENKRNGQQNQIGDAVIRNRTQSNVLMH